MVRRRSSTTDLRDTTGVSIFLKNCTVDQAAAKANFKYSRGYTLLLIATQRRRRKTYRYTPRCGFVNAYVSISCNNNKKLPSHVFGVSGCVHMYVCLGLWHSLSPTPNNGMRYSLKIGSTEKAPCVAIDPSEPLELSLLEGECFCSCPSIGSIALKYGVKSATMGSATVFFVLLFISERYTLTILTRMNSTKTRASHLTRFQVSKI